MNSRPARLTLSVLAWIALGAVAFYTFDTQQQIDLRRNALRTFESSARDAADALDDAQAGQQAYVALGQAASDWMPKVTTFLQTASSSIDTLRSTARSTAAGAALLDASTSVTQVGNVDRHVRELIASGDMQAAADAIFADATDALSSAVSNVDAAVSAEQQAADAFEHQQQRTQVYAMGGVAGLIAIVLAILGFAAPTRRDAEAAEPSAVAENASFAALAHQAVFDRAPVATPQVAEDPVTPSLPVDALTRLAELCTGFGRVTSADELKVLLERGADLLHARGLIVWLGDGAGGDLRAVLAHGYSDATLARISTVPRSADNAAAAAYRSGDVQIVRSRPGAAQGAIVAPLMAGQGCIGALTAELSDESEESETTRALSLILASQLAGVLASAAESASAPAPEAKTAAG